MTKNDNLPEGVGPHEEKELDLMLSGDKPLTMFSDTIPSSMELPEAEFQPYVENGFLVKKETITKVPNYKDITLRHIYYAPKDEAWRIDAMIEINNTVFSGTRPITDEEEKETGYLLGYTPEQVSIYLNWKNQIEND